MQNNTILIFEGCSEASSQIAEKISTRNNIKIFNQANVVRNIDVEDVRHHRDEFFHSEFVEFLKQTNTSVILNNVFFHYIIECNDILEYRDKEHLLTIIDEDYSSADCIIAFVSNDTDDYDRQKYVTFLNNARCKSIHINNNNYFDAAIEIESFVKMHQKLAHHRNSFYNKFISYGRFYGNKLLFLAEKDFDYLTKTGLEKRILTTSGQRFEQEYLEQSRASDNTRFIDLILDKANINKFETSYTTLIKSDIEKLTQFDVDILKLELKLLRPKYIVTLSKKLAECISKLEETKQSVIKHITVPMIYSETSITDISNEIRTLVNSNV